MIVLVEPSALYIKMSIETLRFGFMAIAVICTQIV